MKKYILFFGLFFLLFPTLSAQITLGGLPARHSSRPLPYRGERPRINDLVHTDIAIRPRFDTRTVDGRVLITLRPHFYSVDSLTLDAKSMKIHSLSVEGRQAKYRYDGRQIKIRLPRTFRRNETYRVSIRYTAYPDSVPSEPGQAITDNRGFYFINEKPGRYPAQFWTQGEPESNSVWFPTIDSPNQKSTEKLSVTVPDGWVTLSNGIKIAEHPNPDGTRTHVWSQDKPHAPYLFFVAGGPFAVVRDSLGSMPVNYYVEKKYVPVARQIFGKTPRMIRYYEKITGIPFPWDKFSQIVTRKFVSGAMENTTAVNHSEMAYQDADQLIDDNRWEDVIAHELFHQWFGDYVTAESWSQIAMNESFADYGEALWEEYDEGPDKRDYKLEQDLKTYLMMPGAASKPLVRYRYARPDDVFDVVSYQKGALILHYLRHLVGDSAFFAGLHRYLDRNAFGTGEAARLRLAMEDVSGRDLKPFFDQWFYGSGHPVYEVDYIYHDTTGGGTVEVRIRQQTPETYRFPLDIDIYEGNRVHHHNVRVTDSLQSFRFPYRRRPSLVNVDAAHVVPSVIHERRADSTYYFQYFHAPRYKDRRLGLDKALARQDRREAFRVVAAALDDPFYILRMRAIQGLDIRSPHFNRRIERRLVRIARYDRRTIVQAEALRKLGQLRRKSYIPLFRQWIDSPSKAVREAAFEALSRTDPKATLRLIERLAPEQKEKLAPSIALFYARQQVPGTESFVARHLFNNELSLFGGMRNTKDIQKAIRWITTGDNLEANRILADKFLELAEKFEVSGIRNFIKMTIRSYIRNQKKNNGPHRQQIIDYYRKTLHKLSAQTPNKS